MQQTINIDDNLIRIILGSNDVNLQTLNDYFKGNISVYRSNLTINAKSESEVTLFTEVITTLVELAKNNISISPRDISYVVEAKIHNDQNIVSLYLHSELISKTRSGQAIYPKSTTQLQYYDAIKSSPLVFGIGPAGTGKTFIPVAYASRLLKENKIKKIILTRPAVEAGESLGFLPGDLKEKVDPYLRPLYDALYDFLGREAVDDKISKNIIEIAPLAYMRGRTLDNAVVILDEAQNTTYAQMKMFLTRMGYNCKMIVTGDISQIDLPPKVESGLKSAMHIIGSEPQIKIIKFDKIDVVRHPLVKKILACYETYEKNK